MAGVRDSQFSPDQLGTVQEPDVCTVVSLEEPDSPYNDSELSDDYTSRQLSALPLRSEYYLRIADTVGSSLGFVSTHVIVASNP